MSTSEVHLQKNVSSFAYWLHKRQVRPDKNQLERFFDEVKMFCMLSFYLGLNFAIFVLPVLATSPTMGMCPVVALWCSRSLTTRYRFVWVTRCGWSGVSGATMWPANVHTLVLRLCSNRRISLRPRIICSCTIRTRSLALRTTS